MKKINEDQLTTAIGFLALFFAFLGAFNFISIEKAVFATGICVQLVSYYVKK